MILVELNNFTRQISGEKKKKEICQKDTPEISTRHK